MKLLTGFSLSVLLGLLLAPQRSTATVSTNTACYPPPSGLVGWWQLEGNASDSAGPNNGTPVGDVSYGAGKVGQGLVSDGQTAALNLGTASNLWLQSFTIETWVRRASSSFVSYQGNGNGHFFSLGGPGSLAFYYDATGQPVLDKQWYGNIGAGVTVTDTNWHHLAVTKDQSTVVFYIDGTPHPVAPFDPGFQNGTPAAIGGWFYNGAVQNSFYGSIDEVSVYNRALAASEIQAIFAADAAGKCLPTVAAPTVTVQPVSVVTNLGASVNFTVSASGTAPLSYQWYFEGSLLLAGKTAATLNLTNVQLGNAGTYSVVVSNPGGSVRSSNALLTVTLPECVAPPAGIVSWWRGEGNALDSMSANNGIPSSSLAYGPGEVGQGFVLNGTTANFRVPYNPSLRLTNALTLETWVLPVRSNVYQNLITRWDAASGLTQKCFTLALDPLNRPYLCLSPSGSDVGRVIVTAPTGLPLNQWAHLAGTYDGSTVSVYVNGSLGASASYTAGIYPGTNDITLGSDGPLYFFAGSMDEVSVYSRALSAPEIQGIYAAGSAGKCPVTVAAGGCTPLPSDAVSWWRAEGNAFDSIGANDGTLAGNTAYAGSEVGQGFVFDGNADGINVGTGTNLWLQNFSVEAWVKRASTTVLSYNGNGNGHIFSVGSGGGYGFYLDASGRPTLSKLQVSVVNANTSITDLNWHHVAVTKMGTNVTFYVDGTPYPAPAYDPGFTFGSAAVIGGWTHNGVYDNTFYGAIDELAVYNRALSATEVESIYTAGSFGKCFTPVAPAITTQPVSVVTNLGLNAAFTVLATGTPPLSYQWRFNGTNLPGQTTNALTLVNLQLTNSGMYSVVVSNQVSVVVSTNALLTVVVPPCTPPPAGILSWWQAESNALDSVDGNMGTLTGNVSYGPGRVGRAFVFDGRGDAVNLGTTSNLWLQSFTIETWVKRTSPTVVSYDGNGNGHFFSIGGPGCMAFYYDPTGQPILGQMWYGGVGPGVRITDTNWHHMAVTKSQGTVVFYIDGVAHPAPNYNPTFSFASPSALGGWFYNGTVQNSFYGSIDELAVYNRALSPAEIQGIYNASVIGKCATPPFIVTQPTGINTIEGSNVTFSVTAGGDPVLHYQWMFNGARIPGATSISLSLTNVQWTNSGAYSVAVANAFGHTVSSNAVLSVDRIPVAQCASVVVAAGSNCTAVASVDQGSYDPDGDPLTLSQSPPAPYALGTNLVTLTVADNRGASNSCTALVVVLDQTPPTLLLPADIVVTNAHNAWTSVVTYAPAATDNCSGVGQPVCVPPSGSAFSLGTTTVNVSATDAAGNAAHGSFKVTVLPGNVPPVPIIQIAPLAHFPGNTNLLVIAPDNQQAKVVLDGSKSYDVDDTNFLSFWYNGTNLVSTNLVATVVLGLGTNDVTLWLDDTFPLGTSSASAQVEVISPAQAVALLEILLNDAGKGQDESLMASLGAASAALKRGDFTAGLNQLQAFENQVSAQVAPADPELADELTQTAQQILTALTPSVAGGSGKVKFLTFTHEPGKMHLKFAGVSGKAHVVQASTNLRDWTTIGTATDNGDGSFDFEDTKAADLPARFYRVVQP